MQLAERLRAHPWLAVACAGALVGITIGLFLPIRAASQSKADEAKWTLPTPASVKRFDEAKYGWDGGPLHDPCVIAYLLQPGLFSGQRRRVSSSRCRRFQAAMALWSPERRISGISVSSQRLGLV